MKTIIKVKIKITCNNKKYNKNNKNNNKRIQ